MQTALHDLHFQPAEPLVSDKQIEALEKEIAQNLLTDGVHVFDRSITHIDAVSIDDDCAPLIGDFLTDGECEVHFSNLIFVLNRHLKGLGFKERREADLRYLNAMAEVAQACIEKAAKRIAEKECGV